MRVSVGQVTEHKMWSLRKRQQKVTRFSHRRAHEAFHGCSVQLIWNRSGLRADLWWIYVSVEDERIYWPWSYRRRRSHLCPAWRIGRIDHEQFHLSEGRSCLCQQDQAVTFMIRWKYEQITRFVLNEDVDDTCRIVLSHLWIRNGHCFRILSGTVPGELHLLNLSVIQLCISKIFPSCRPPYCSVWCKHLLWNWKGRKGQIYLLDFITRCWRYEQ